MCDDGGISHTWPSYGCAIQLDSLLWRLPIYVLAVTHFTYPERMESCWNSVYMKLFGFGKWGFVEWVIRSLGPSKHVSYGCIVFYVLFVLHVFRSKILHSHTPALITQCSKVLEFDAVIFGKWVLASISETSSIEAGFDLKIASKLNGSL